MGYCVFVVKDHCFSFLSWKVPRNTQIDHIFSLENAKYLKIKKNKDEIYIRNTAVCKNDYKVTKNRGRVVFMGLIFGDKFWRALFGLAPSAA